VSCLPQSFDVRMSSIFSHYWISCIMVSISRCRWGSVKMCCSYQCGRVQTPILYWYG